jgi:hypothetical protein
LHPNSLGGEVDVAPLQPQQLALPETSECGGQEHGPVGVPEWFLVNVDSFDQCDQLGFVEKPDVGGPLDLGELDLLARISPAPALAPGEGEDL